MSATTTHDPTTVHEAARLIQAEYLEMPGMQLTRPQVCRLWHLEPDVCDAVLEALVHDHFLEKTARQSYVLSPYKRH
jgi:hypothetical protein